MNTWVVVLTTLFLLKYLATGESSRHAEGRHIKQDIRKCPVSLPQKSSKTCKILRERELNGQRGIFQLAIKPPLPMPLVNMTSQQLTAHHSQDEFAKEYYLNYLSMVVETRRIGEQWITQYPEEIADIQEYKNYFKEFRESMANESSNFFRFVTTFEPLPDILNNWQDDSMFAEQRLSGCNPMVLRKVTNDYEADVGLQWSKLRKTLNPNFNWEAAVQAAMEKDLTLEEAIRKDYVYVLRYEVFDDVVSFPDMANDCASRTTKSPIALFVVNKDKRLRPAAIQIDHKPDSPVFSPDDGDSWMFAKSVVQATDYEHGQIVEHLLKAHLFSEPFCVVMHRQLSSKHPLNEILKIHCRGLMAANTLGAPQLITPGTLMDKPGAMGPKGTLLVVGRSYRSLSWKDADYYLDIKKRGLDNKKVLKYFPYRDDSELIFKTIKRMVEDYLSTYYQRNSDVKKDEELQAFVNELSAKGSGPNGGNGQIKDFPASLETKKEIFDIVTQLKWLLCVKHNAVDYPMNDYDVFTPLTPTKVYNNVSVAQMEVAVNVGTYHYDVLFDYYEQLTDPFASEVVRFYHSYVKSVINPMMIARNKKRYRRGHLTYPYLEHYWLQKHIQT